MGDPKGETGSGSSEQASPGVVHVAREGLRLYRNFDKLDRFAGGGFGFSTLVKIAGWAGLIAVLAALAVRLRTVEQQLDPVAGDVAKLRAQLEDARMKVSHQASVSADALSAVDSDARTVRKSLADAEDGATMSLHAVNRTAAQEEVLRSELHDGVAQVQSLKEETAAMSREVTASGDEVAASRTALHGAASTVMSQSDELQAELGKAKGQAAVLSGKLDAVEVSETRASLDDVRAKARALSDALAASTASANQLRQVLDERVAEEKAARERAAAARAASVSTAPVAAVDGPVPTSKSPPSGR